MCSNFNHSTDLFMSESATLSSSAGDNILDAAAELRAAASARAQQFRDALQSDDAKAAADRLARETMQRWREVSDNAAAFIKENPAKAALAALGIGFAIGLLFRRD
jgi:ElaB/YqjD/DUF883 family membrane-anchored ribosome-binding protein